MKPVIIQTAFVRHISSLMLIFETQSVLYYLRGKINSESFKYIENE